MRALLDVNLLIALLDAAHIDHDKARTWLETNIVSITSFTPRPGRR